MTRFELAISFLGDALTTAAYILNWVSTKIVNSTPFEFWTKRNSNLNCMFRWGCNAYINYSSNKFRKLEHRGKNSIFLGYSETSKGYMYIVDQTSGSVTNFESLDTMSSTTFQRRARLVQTNVYMRYKIKLSQHLFIRVGEMMSKMMN